MNESIGLRIKQKTVNASVIKILRRYGSESISELTRNIKEEKYVKEVSYFEEEEIKELIRCSEELIKEGVEIELYEDERKCSIDYLKNLVKTYESISSDDDSGLNSLYNL